MKRSPQALNTTTAPESLSESALSIRSGTIASYLDPKNPSNAAQTTRDFTRNHRLSSGKSLPAIIGLAAKERADAALNDLTQSDALFRNKANHDLTQLQAALIEYQGSQNNDFKTCIDALKSLKTQKPFDSFTYQLLYNEIIAMLQPEYATLIQSTHAEYLETIQEKALQYSQKETALVKCAISLALMNAVPQTQSFDAAVEPTPEVSTHPAATQSLFKCPQDGLTLSTDQYFNQISSILFKQSLYQEMLTVGLLSTTTAESKLEELHALGLESGIGLDEEILTVMNQIKLRIHQIPSSEDSESESSVFNFDDQSPDKSLHPSHQIKQLLPTLRDIQFKYEHALSLLSKWTDGVAHTDDNEINQLKTTLEKNIQQITLYLQDQSESNLLSLINTLEAGNTVITQNEKIAFLAAILSSIAHTSIEVEDSSPPISLIHTLTLRSLQSLQFFQQQKSTCIENTFKTLLMCALPSQVAGFFYPLYQENLQTGKPYVQITPNGMTAYHTDYVTGHFEALSQKILQHSQAKNRCHTLQSIHAELTRQLEPLQAAYQSYLTSQSAVTQTAGLTPLQRLAATSLSYVKNVLKPDSPANQTSRAAQIEIITRQQTQIQKTIDCLTTPDWTETPQIIQMLELLEDSPEVIIQSIISDAVAGLNMVRYQCQPINLTPPDINWVLEFDIPSDFDPNRVSSIQSALQALGTPLDDLTTDSIHELMCNTSLLLNPPSPDNPEFRLLCTKISIDPEQLHKKLVTPSDALDTLKAMIMEPAHQGSTIVGQAHVGGHYQAISLLNFTAAYRFSRGLLNTYEPNVIAPSIENFEQELRAQINDLNQFITQHPDCFAQIPPCDLSYFKDYTETYIRHCLTIFRQSQSSPTQSLASMLLTLSPSMEMERFARILNHLDCLQVLASSDPITFKMLQYQASYSESYQTLLQENMHQARAELALYSDQNGLLKNSIHTTLVQLSQATQKHDHLFYSKPLNEAISEALQLDDSQLEAVLGPELSLEIKSLKQQLSMIEITDQNEMITYLQDQETLYTMQPNAIHYDIESAALTLSLTPGMKHFTSLKQHLYNQIFSSEMIKMHQQYLCEDRSERMHDSSREWIILYLTDFLTEHPEFKQLLAGNSIDACVQQYQKQWNQDCSGHSTSHEAQLSASSEGFDESSCEERDLNLKHTIPLLFQASQNRGSIIFMGLSTRLKSAHCTTRHNQAENMFHTMIQAYFEPNSDEIEDFHALSKAFWSSTDYDAFHQALSRWDEAFEVGTSIIKAEDLEPEPEIEAVQASQAVISNEKDKDPNQDTSVTGPSSHA
ncbi:MAG: hypothetical protein CMF51_01700 [Legionellales bacterium]|nr:hypothetical protein [Legionellales bacterium]